MAHIKPAHWQAMTPEQQEEYAAYDPALGRADQSRTIGEMISGVTQAASQALGGEQGGGMFGQLLGSLFGGGMGGGMMGGQQGGGMGGMFSNLLGGLFGGGRPQQQMMPPMMGGGPMMGGYNPMQMGYGMMPPQMRPPAGGMYGRPTPGGGMLPGQMGLNPYARPPSPSMFGQMFGPTGFGGSGGFSPWTSAGSTGMQRYDLGVGGGFRPRQPRPGMYGGYGQAQGPGYAAPISIL